MVWGRPRAFDDAEEFKALCQGYFASLKFNAPNIAGLCVFLGISRETWYDYKKKRKEFSDTIKQTELCVESWWVNRLKSPGAGAIFYLKNFRPKEFKDRTPGEEGNPIFVTARITGMRIMKEAK